MSSAGSARCPGSTLASLSPAVASCPLTRRRSASRSSCSCAACIRPINTDLLQGVGWLTANLFRVSVTESSRTTQRPREDRLTHPADTSRSNLADALLPWVCLSRWRLPKPRTAARRRVCMTGRCGVETAAYLRGGLTMSLHARTSGCVLLGSLDFFTASPLGLAAAEQLLHHTRHGGSPRTASHSPTTPQLGSLNH